jgi:hypothetical protein
MIADTVSRFCELTLDPTTKGISWEISRTAGIPQKRKSVASGSRYRGRILVGAALLALRRIFVAAMQRFGASVHF